MSEGEAVHVRLPAPGRVTRILALVAAALVLADLILDVLTWRLPDSAVLGSLARLFDLDGEVTVPSWYSASLMLLCAVLLAGNGLAYLLLDPRHARRWLALAAVFVALSLDETAALHERTALPIRTFLGAGGLLYYAWVIPGALFAAAVGVASVRFLRELPPDTRLRFIGAGALFLGGALGMELWTGWLVERYGERHVAYVVATAVEEGLEMAGLLYFIHALLVHARAHLKEVRVVFDPRPLVAVTPIEAAPPALRIRRGA
jgi:hypothetical protein